MNMAPEVFQTSGFLEKGQFGLVCAEGPTCVSPRGNTVLDCFVAHVGLLEAIAHVRRDESSFIPSHTPVHLEFVPNSTSAKGLRLYQPERLSVKPVVGP